MTRTRNDVMTSVPPSRRRNMVSATALLVLLLPLFALCGCGEQGGAATTGSEESPLRVMLIPAFGGTESGTKAIFQPLFDAITESHDLHFDLSVGSSYSAVVEAMANEQVDIAWFGTVSYMQARERGAAELLAVAVDHGDSVYYSAIFVGSDSGIETLEDLKGKSVAFGDPSSTSSFNYPVAMLLQENINPVQDLGKVVITDSHAASLGALAKGDVDAACSNTFNHERAIREGVFPKDFSEAVATSIGIPNPPLAMHPKLPDDVKKKLKNAFHHLHENPNVKPEMIRGEGNKVYERYDAEFPEEHFVEAMEKLSGVTDELKQAMLRKAQQTAAN